MKEKATLLLEDGTVFYGLAHGKKGTVSGEICFNTGMTGYQEVFTDPSYFGQIITMTNVHIGNYGTIEEDMESNMAQISGLICKNFATRFSRYRANNNLQDFLKDNNVLCISNIDTRALVRHIRTKGAMNCIISSEILDNKALEKKLSNTPKMNGLELASKVSVDSAYTIGNEKSKNRVAVLDLGIKKNMIHCLLNEGYFVKIFPAITPFKEIKKFKPTGCFISNGPGDPAAATYAIKTVQDILQEKIPLFGICLGHQILALAKGISTFKMHHGHRGINHPVKNVLKGTSEITSQNHGFEVNREDVEVHKEVEITHVNLNDNTVEGIRLLNQPAFSVQYHPEASPGPHDSHYLFKDFTEMMKKHN